MAAPLIPLPGPGEQSPEDFMQISRRALQQASIHLAEGDRLQASEKVSGAVAAATKAVGGRRSWRHDSHALRDSIIAQLGLELGQSTPLAQTIYNGASVARRHHDNFFENTIHEGEILHAIGNAEAFVQVIDQMMSEPPSPYTVTRDTDARRIAQLTGHEPDVGVTDALGFANFTGELRGE